MYRIGVDVGGTFTDFVLLDEQSGKVIFFKVPSTPGDPSEGIQHGIERMLGDHGIDPASITHLGHGTTVATNMVIEKRGSATGLLTTKGFRDVLEIGRQVRPNLYDYSVGKPPPLVARQHRLEIEERMSVAGEVINPMQDIAVETAVLKLKNAGIRAVAVCFLHSYRASAHEQRARAIIERVFPEAYISISSEVLPEFREYERLSTTVLNAYIGPRIQIYLDRFLQRVRKLGIAAEPYTIHSNGGLMSVETVRQHPVRTCLSGPAAGVVGASKVGKASGFRNVVTFDVGGTSTDVSLIYNSHPLFTGTRLVADYPMKTPMIDIHVIGAGGGSIAWIDDAGALKVGPRSAGAEPGPVAYGKGGVEPTITDANVLLNRLNPETLLGGRMKLDAAKARTVIRDSVARPLGLGTEAAAHGMLRIVNANMSRAIRSVSTERGYDISEFALFAYGGAGPLHATEVARECGIPKVIVPREPGTMCARGILLSDISLDFVRSEILQVTKVTWERACELFAEMLAAGKAWLARERVEESHCSFVCHIDARYQGQNHEVQVALAGIDPEGLPQFLRDFAAAHKKEYGYDISERIVEIVNCRLQAVGSVPKAPMPPVEGGKSLEEAVTGQRDVYFSESLRWITTRVYARERLPVERPFEGPAIIDEMSSTTVVLPDQSAYVDAIGNIIIDVRPQGRASR